MKLDVYDPLDRDIARMFTGKNIRNGYLVGVSGSGFICKFEDELYTTEMIEIDLSKTKMDLRMALGTDIRFDIRVDDDEYAEGYKLTGINQLDNTIAEYQFEDIEGIGYDGILLANSVRNDK